MTHPPPTTRRQLSLFVPQGIAAELEAVRLVLDPVQARLIPAHVTLCREDELGQLPEVELRRRLAAPGMKPLTLRFGPPEAFHGHGVLLNCVDGAAEFDALRTRLLGVGAARPHRPHLTLAHPRNPKAPGNSLAHAARLAASLTITFPALHLIEQVEGEPWRTLERFELLG